jgi:5-methyltetrahydropteroyltriglutamate--homocysteine methyltransferase
LSRGRAAYASKEELGEDLVQILREEVLTLRDAGVGFLPLDEPVLTELVFTSGQTRTFMCATVASRADPAEELEFAAGLMNRVVDGLEGVRTGVHICRGNRSRQERLLLSGSYPPLAPYPARLNVDQLVLEFATPRAGELGALLGCEPIRQNNELGLGVTNPRTEDVDLVESITAGVDECLQWLRTGQIFLNPDCGSGTFSSRPVNSSEIIDRKLRVMVGAAVELMQTLQPGALNRPERSARGTERDWQRAKRAQVEHLPRGPAQGR